jgi:hypothetical protein
MAVRVGREKVLAAGFVHISAYSGDSRRLARRMVLASRRSRTCSNGGAMRPLAIAFLINAPIFAQNLTTIIDKQLSGLLEIYQDYPRSSGTLSPGIPHVRLTRQ